MLCLSGFELYYRWVPLIPLANTLVSNRRHKTTQKWTIVTELFERKISLHM